MTNSAADRRAAQRRRELNLMIASISEQNRVTRPLGLACECGSPDCLESLPISAPEFAALQSLGEPVLAPAHRDRTPASEAAAPVDEPQRVDRPASTGRARWALLGSNR
jgi:hypothetical protein